MTTPPPAPPRVVSRFEANLLKLVRFFLLREPYEQVANLLANRLDRPKCLSRDGVRLAEDRLAKGTMWLLAHGGGWRSERHLRGDRVAAGRLWERTPPEQLALEFSGQTLEFLLWVLTEYPQPTTPFRPPAERLTVGDHFFFALAYQALRPTTVGRQARGWPVVQENALCWLLHPDEFADRKAQAVPEMAPWVTGAGAAVLEAWQGKLTEAWVGVEHQKMAATNWQQLRDVGQNQGRILDAYFAACDAAGRRDLARWALKAAAQLAVGRPGAQAWVGNLVTQGPRLADRVETYRAALVLFRRLDTLRAWEQEARTVGYLDEGYHAAQLYKADWEAAHGEDVWDHGHRMIRELEPLPT